MLFDKEPEVLSVAIQVLRWNVSELNWRWEKTERFDEVFFVIAVIIILLILPSAPDDIFYWFLLIDKRWGSEFSSYEIELRNQVTQNDVILRVTNSRFFIEFLLSSY